MSLEPAQTAWTLAEELAIEKFYLKINGKIADGPALLLFNNFFCKGWQLSFGQMHIFRFKSKAEAYRKIQDVANSSKVADTEILLKIGKRWKIVARKLETAEASES